GALAALARATGERDIDATWREALLQAATASPTTRTTVICRARVAVIRCRFVKECVKMRPPGHAGKVHMSGIGEGKRRALALAGLVMACTVYRTAPAQEWTRFGWDAGRSSAPTTPTGITAANVASLRRQ